MQTTDPLPGQHKLMFVILRMPSEIDLGQGPTSAEGVLIPGHTTCNILRAIEEQRKGCDPGEAIGMPVRVTLHETGNCGQDLGLTPREREVLCALAKGMSYKMIADALGISFETVRTHLKGVYLKMSVNNNTAAVAKAIHFGMVAA